MHNVELLTLPPHCSHLLQPFDVAAAQSLKSLMNKLKIDRTTADYANSLPSNAAKARYLTVYSMIEAWRCVPLQVFKNGFSHSGIYPFNPAVPLSSSYVNPRINTPNINNGLLLTSDHNRLVLYNNTIIAPENDVASIPKVNYNTIYPSLTNTLPTYGRILSYFPSLFVMTSENNYSKVFS